MITHYDQCHDGPFHPMRTHNDEFGWAVVYATTGVVFARVGAKGVAFGLAAALNGHWAAAQEFIGLDAPHLDAAYMERFKRDGEWQ